MASAILVYGFGLNGRTIVYATDPKELPAIPQVISNKACNAAAFICIFLYGLTKVWVYLFLIERVYLVLTAGTSEPRLSTRIYKCGLVGIVIYLGILPLLLIGKLAKTTAVTIIPLIDVVTHDTYQPILVKEACSVGLNLYGTIPLAVYDIVITSTLTAMFVIPIAKSGASGQKKVCWISRMVLPVHSCFRKLAFYWKRGIASNWTIRSGKEKPSLLLPISPHHCHSGTEERSSGSFISPLESSESKSIVTEIPTLPPLVDPNKSSPNSSNTSLALTINSSNPSACLHRLARRSLFASLVALITSTINILVLYHYESGQDGSRCMLWCIIDAFVNALAIWFVTKGCGERSGESNGTRWLRKGPDTARLEFLSKKRPPACKERDIEFFSPEEIQQNSPHRYSFSVRQSAIQIPDSIYSKPSIPDSPLFTTSPTARSTPNEVYRFSLDSFLFNTRRSIDHSGRGSVHTMAKGKGRETPWTIDEYTGRSRHSSVIAIQGHENLGDVLRAQEILQD
ncbi:hypothetical protein CPB86DRAFT_816249 [Serendipita vermifera]|nr:hypothetical protein CPB86DRAFT_816249 [Serendipita vermifera]